MWGRPFEAFHLRTVDQSEMDLLLLYRGKTWVFEVKLTSAPDVRDLHALERMGSWVGADRAVLISRSSENVLGDTKASVDLAGALDLLRQA